MIKLSDYVADFLLRQGIDTVFMVSGGGAMHLNDSFGKRHHYVPCHHEQACAIAAEGYYRASKEGRVAAVNVTTGPGGLNTINGLFGQWTDSIPVIYISGQVKTSTCMTTYKELPLRQLGDQEVDIIECVKPLCKYAVSIKDPYSIRYHLEKALRIATTGRKGPVWIDIPINIQASLIDEDKLVGLPKIGTLTYDDMSEEVLSRIKKAKRPLLVAGHGIRLSNQKENFKRLVDLLNIPVVTTFNGFDLLPSDDVHFAGRIGTVGQRKGNFALQNADVVLFLGTRNNIRQISYNYENFAKNAYKIIVDIDEAELVKPTVQADFPICEDLNKFIPALIDKIEVPLRIEDWWNFINHLKNRFNFESEEAYRKISDKINVYKFINALTTSLQAGDILVAANGSACVCLHQVGIVKANQRIFWNSGDASMGYDLPAAIGASISNPEKEIYCLAGDGSIMMNLQELATIKTHNLPIKVLIINNSGYSSIRQTQRNFFAGRMTGCGLTSGVGLPNFENIALAFGLAYLDIKTDAELQDKLELVKQEKGPIICEIFVEEEYAFIPKLSSKKLEDGTMVSPTLEDMFPFIDREEYSSLMFKKDEEERN